MAAMNFISFSSVILGATTFQRAAYSGGWQHRNAYRTYRVKATLPAYWDSYFGSAGRPYNQLVPPHGGNLAALASGGVLQSWRRSTGSMVPATDSTWAGGTHAVIDEGIMAGVSGTQGFDENFCDVLHPFPYSASEIFRPLSYVYSDAERASFISDSNPTHASWSRYPYIRDRHEHNAYPGFGYLVPGRGAMGPVGDRACFISRGLSPAIEHFIDSTGVFLTANGHPGSTSGGYYNYADPYTFDSGWFPSCWGVPPMRLKGWSSLSYDGIYPVVTKRVSITQSMKLSAMRLDGSTYDIREFGPINWTETSDTLTSLVQRTAYSFDQTFNGVAPADAAFLRWSGFATPVGNAGGTSYTEAFMPFVPSIPDSATNDHITGVRSQSAFIFRAP